MITPYHARYFAHELTRRQPEGVDRLSMALFDACVDLNPHQIEAALFALRSPISKGAILADEVGLGKTIEAGLAICQCWAERKRRILVICPASLRKQWSMELEEKFNLPTVILDSRTYRLTQADGKPQPFQADGVVITSMNFASKMRADVRAVPWELVIVDEAHKLRNAYRPSNKMGQNIKWALEDRKKLLLTATPLQNSLLELYGLASVLDDMIFGDLASFRTQYTNAGGDMKALRERISCFCKRTLRQHVTEYIQYTERRPVTIKFRPTDDEQKLYEAVSEFLKREDTLAIPKRQRHLTTLILRKLLASSSHAVANTLETIKGRLELLQQKQTTEEELVEELVLGEELEEEYLDEMLAETTEESGEPSGNGQPTVDLKKVQGEIDDLMRYSQWARSIGIDTKSRRLLDALKIGFDEMANMGARRKALVFTESRRTQEYLKNFLEANGYGGQLVLFNGTNSDPESRRIIDQWIEANAKTGRVTGSRQVDCRTALLEHFRDHATVMIATEAAAEGVNLQFCSLVINYDLPWNPQRIEQRIGRCHRYNQKYDVVVINFLNERNEADRRVLELLAQKFNLFNGIFGASDEVLGTIESGVDFEKRILAIYQQCRTPEEIDAAFRQLQQEMDETIRTRLADTRRILLEHFDEDVHARLRMRLTDAQANLDRIGQLFWRLTRYILANHATFNESALAFDLPCPPHDGLKPGRYHLISKTQPNVPGEFLYRLSHPLGEYVIQTGKTCSAPVAHVTFDVTHHPMKVSMVEALKGQSGWLTLQHLVIESYDREDYLLFSAFNDAGRSLDQETCERLFHCDGKVDPIDGSPLSAHERMDKEAERHAQAAIAKSLEANSRFFNEERERLEKWADDMVIAAEKDLADTKAQIKAVRRQTRLATTLDEQNDLQQKIRELEKTQRRQRQEIFTTEDQIAEKRDALIDGLQKRLRQKTTTNPLFTIRWTIA
jgi:ERCC4-related helicase